MATRRYSLNVGDVDKDVTEAVGAAVATKSIELTVDLAGTGLTTAEGKRRVLMALDQFKNWILKGNWPPA